jgi:hypothetical protein
MPAPFEVARFCAQNVARAPELVNNTSHARTIQLAAKGHYAQW